MARPEHLNPFVLPVEPVEPDRRDRVDLYLPDATQPRPAIVFVHGGPIPSDLRPTPRDWPVYQGYGSLAANRGAVGVTVDHRLHDAADYPRAAADVATAVRATRGDPRVDADRVALWFFSGGGLLVADWLRAPPAWLRCIALTYPLLAPLPGTSIGRRFRPIDAAHLAGLPPIVLTQVGLERAPVADTVEEFIVAARSSRAQLHVIDVPHGRHGFDVLDHTEESREAVDEAFDATLTALT